MSQRYFLGLDGGGTKTDCVVYDAETGRLELSAGGATNHEALPDGMEGLPVALAEIITPLLSKMDIGYGDVCCAVFGMGGVDTPMQHDIIAQMIDGLGFARFTLANDAYLGVKAECGETGISAVNGSGYSVVGINKNGDMLQIGGHNDMTGDMGGGTYLVPAAVRTVYAELFKNGKKTAMTGLFADWLGKENPAEFCQSVAIAIMTDSVSAYNVISKILYKAASMGDEAARGILTACGEDYALSVRCVAEKLELSYPIDVALVGSQFTKCEDACAIDAMKNALDAEKFRLHVITTKPVAGALLWALENGGIKLSADEKTELKRRINALEV